MLTTGFASIRVLLVESWEWNTDVFRNKGEREIKLFELRETESILFSKGERFEVTLPEHLLPSISINPTPSVSHSLQIHFSWHTTTQNSISTETSVHQIPLKIAPFSRKDLDRLLASASETKCLPASLASLLPPGFVDRKQRDVLRKQSIETLMNSSGGGGSSGSMASIPWSLGRKLRFGVSEPLKPPGGSGVTSSFGLLSHKGPNELNRGVRPLNALEIRGGALKRVDGKRDEGSGVFKMLGYTKK
ncbi:hypothetical protein HDU98_003918 [Podochytrium sp. JEL0797]|nr:hypothetical protein HDU98_003918 [Podochytrium sp. JEL0797]